MEKKIIDIWKSKKASNKTLFDFSNISYPVIPDNTSNFLTDYSAAMDPYTVRMWGERFFTGLEAETDAALMTEYDEAVKAALLVHLDNWARLYYALNISYNPIWNYDGETTFEHGEQVITTDIPEKENTSDYADRVREEDMKQREDTNEHGQHTDTSKDYAVAFDGTTEKETGKSEMDNATYTDTFTAGAHKDIITDKAHLDTFTEGAHLDTVTHETFTDTETRHGNQGTTTTQQMLSEEWEFRKNTFFRTVFKTLIDDIGCHY